MADLTFVSQAADQALQIWGLDRAASSEEIARLVSDGTTYWQQDLHDGSHLSLIRLFSPVVRREEVFLGNVLLNDFLSKTLIRAAENGGTGRMALLANDLESYYYIYHGRSTLADIRECLRQEISASLPDLYFGEEDPARGIFGNTGRMLTFYKSNIEPFPAFTVPRALLPSLLDKANENLRQLAADKETNINVILAILSFFYAKNGAEMQSVYAFLNRAMGEDYFSADKIRAVFALDQGEDFDKKTFMERKKGDVIDRDQLQEAIEVFLARIQEEIEQGHAESVAANLANKMTALSIDEAANVLSQGVLLGFLPLGDMRENIGKLPCRFCGTDEAIIVEKNITGGFGAGRFYNQSPKIKPFEQALCGRCGISSYLETKLLGMQIARPQPKSKDYPVPKQYNIVFHYGRHDEAEAQQLKKTIDDLFDLINEYRRRASEEEHTFSLEYMREEIANRAAERKVGDAELPSAEDAIAALIADDDVIPGLEILVQTPQGEETQVLPLGLGDYQLLVFIIPRLRPGRSEALDFVNRRLSRSRLAAFTLLALLRKLCSCDGPYYFQSVPTLSPGGFDCNTFYVQGNAENADEVIKRYSAIVNFARRVSKYRDGHSLLADWILLAEQLEEDPLGKFSDVLRDSPLRGGDDLRGAKYRRLSNSFVKGTAMIDGIEYLKMINQLSQL